MDHWSGIIFQTGKAETGGRMFRSPEPSHRRDRLRRCIPIVGAVVQADPSADDDQWQRFVTFWRGVGVNVIANIVAAAILYPGGVLFGLLPKIEQPS